MNFSMRKLAKKLFSSNTIPCSSRQMTRAYGTVSVASLVAMAAFALSLIIGYPSVAFAASNDSPAPADSPVAQADMAPLEITCTYTTPRVGTPTTFTMHGSGGSGNYKYLQNYIHILLNGSFTDDADWSYKSYTTDNTFTYTFVAPGTYELRLYIMDVDSSPITTARTIFRVTVEDSPGSLTVEQKADELAQAALDAGCTTDYEKALFVHDWLISNAAYDHSLEYDGESGVLLRGKGTCESFYRGYALVLQRLGIRSERALGNGHVWNRLLLDGSWTHVDATWDAGQSLTGNQAYLSHLYFGLTDEMIQEAHNEYVVVPGQKATNFNNNYYVRSGEVALWADDLCEKIARALEAGETNLEVATPYNAYPAMYSVMGRAAAYYASTKDWGPYSVGVHLDLRGELNKESVYQVIITDKAPEPEPGPEPSQPTEPATPAPDTPGNPGGGSTSGGNNGNDNTSGAGNSGGTSSGTDAPGNGSPGGSTPGNGNIEADIPESGTTGAAGTEVTRGQWVKDGTGWWYRQNNGAYPRSSWQFIDSQWYYFGPTGYMQTGWVKVGPSWYYLTKSGTMATGWQYINGTWYYLYPTGVMATGWVKDGEKWYHLGTNGAMTTGWQKIGRHWYYLNGSGIMATGWQKVHGSWYYFNPTLGAMQTGWLKLGTTWYYMHASGAMATGWQSISGHWYYLHPSSGAMAADTTVGSYYVNAGGVWVA